jgi:AraC-like DNA-binding protein
MKEKGDSISQFVGDIRLNEDWIDLISAYDDAAFWAKNTSSKFTMVNDNFVSVLGADHRSEVLGKGDHDFFIPEIAEKFVKDDEHVMVRKKLLRVIEPIPSLGMINDEHQTVKIPALNSKGDCIGVVGIAKKIPSKCNSVPIDAVMKPAIDYIKRNIDLKIKVSDIARVTKLSRRSLERRFFEVFEMSISSYINQSKINRVSQKLVFSDDSILKITLDTGYCDQSYMSSCFKKQFKLTPKQYRLRHKKSKT